jgi:VanZ family protein
MKSWLWVLLCTAVIYSTIPVARSMQKFISANIGREFFTHAVIFCIVCGFCIVFYFLITKLKVKNITQYLWLLLCGSIMIYFTLALKKYPEEAVHLLEYSILSFVVFRALSFKIQDWTVYISTVLIASVIGTFDELIQWITPDRVGHYKDIQLNTVSGLIGVLIISFGIRPAKISQSVSQYSRKFLITATILSLMIIGFSLFALIPDK